ncbi:MAG: DUF4393 domain-containing protein [Bacteroidetes bacterium]|nr:DUF4393 domain-containing protein [Bacteroidota bacterium]MCA6442985.1 DUF4393 domain-containing protein [Bacteroidota bacterium]
MGEINIKSTTIEKSIELLQDLLKCLVGKPISEIGSLLEDKVKLWRLKNQITTLNKVKSICENENVPFKQVNLKIVFPYLEGISLEDNNTIQTLWANLLVNYMDEKKKLEATVYPEILRQLSSKDVEILENYYKGEIFYDYNNLPVRKTNEDLKYSIHELANLERLGLIRPVLKIYNTSGRGTGIFSRLEVEYASIKVSVFGDLFFNACHR